MSGSALLHRSLIPDVDAIYMTAVTSLTGRGGWPMTVFCDHEGRPFHGGTYWPDKPRGGMPSFPQVLEAVTEAREIRKAKDQERIVPSFNIAATLRSLVNTATEI